MDLRFPTSYHVPAGIRGNDDVNLTSTAMAVILAMTGQSYYIRQQLSGAATTPTPAPTPTPTPAVANKTCAMQTNTFSKDGTNVLLGYLAGDAVNGTNVAAAKSLCEKDPRSFTSCYLGRLTNPASVPLCQGADPCSVVYGNNGGVLTGGVPTTAGTCTAK